VEYTRSIIEIDEGICIEHFSPLRTLDKPPIFFAHGNFCGSWCWHNLLAYFATNGVPSYAINYRGHWLSGGHADLGKATTEDYVQDVKAALTAVGTEVVLVGHSMGGVVCQKVAEQNKLKGLVLLDSGPCKYITENFFTPNPEIMQTLQKVFSPQPDGTVLMNKDPDGIKKIMFEEDNVSAEELALTVAFVGRESAHALQNHAFVSIDPQKIKCPVYVIGRKGMGNDQNPDLWDALAEYLGAEDRFITDRISHNMFQETNWIEHAERIAGWCFK
jgi:pimeloyl-ACP methyl ester carboxylesterase